MKSCRHPSFKWVHDEDLGDRTLKHYRCRACGHPRKRNVKKPRYTTRKPPVAQTPSKRPKTQQKPRVRQRKAIPAVSKRRQAQNRKYMKARDRFLKDHPYCGICEHNFSTQIHHKKHREGKLLLVEEFWIALCGTCHTWVHDQPERAREQGYLL